MKRILYITLSISMLLTTSSCSKDWLDVNVDPNNPTSTLASIHGRLAWIQHHFLYAQQVAGTRSSFITQQLTATSTATRDGMAAGWNPGTAISTTPYQWFFVAAASNFKDLEDKATAQEAWHYIGAVRAIRAMGFMLMTDWYGEMPYTEALSESVTPKFDDGKTIFEGCLQDIDLAIENFKKTQGSNAPTLKEGDSWNAGDVDKWLKMCYGLKARWLNNLSKKTSLYKPDEILSLLSNAPASNAQSTVVNHADLVSDNVGDVLFADPLMTSIVFNSVGMNTNIRVTKWYTDLLTNFDGKAIEDPRADKLIPWAQFNHGQFVRSAGVDMQSDIRINKGPNGTSYNAKDEAIESNGRTVSPHSWYVNVPDPQRWGDTIYVSLRGSSIGYNGDTDDQYKADDGNILATGTFYSRADGPTHLLCYHEMCFIKAEILFNKGDKGGAFTAYKDGIRAHMELMNMKLETYNETVNPSKTPMDETAINNYLNIAIGEEADLTLGKIMTQKYIAMSFMQQKWNDMRRLDFSTDAYPGWAIPYEYFKNADAQTRIPLGKQYRRIRQVSHEINYNSTNWAESHPHAADDDIWSYPVWWDIAE